MFQSTKSRGSNMFDIRYYKPFKMYLQFLGQYPTQSRLIGNLNVTVIICSLVSLMIPAISQTYISIIEKNLDAAMESIPILVTIIVCVIKLLNHKINKEKVFVSEIYVANTVGLPCIFYVIGSPTACTRITKYSFYAVVCVSQYDNLFDLVNQEWESVKSSENQTIYVLDSVTRHGHVLGEAYRTTLLLFMIFFLFVPLFPPLMDVILPLNETRQRQQMFRLNYFVDKDEYFYPIYFHCSWCSFLIVIITVAMDSLRMVLVHHACGLFAVCGYQIGKVTEGNLRRSGTLFEQIKKCVTTHKEALRFYGIIDNSSRTSYFFIILFNMIGITVTAVQIVLYLHKPEEALRIAVFLIAQQFHLLIVTLPGQVLVDYSSELATDVYCSAWYQLPTNIQKMLYIMQIRSGKACKLTAGGLYEMNIENFGTTFKTCASYFTMLLSLKD
ncbi:uncharacterized protein LOC108631933 [Ceratina calcarata]|uniref:Odorant receptor n=1 Tax=Ceratina calcarata TaxID=156304 RepID=A0AAJ7SBJ6_9HYME|nr:uncharacterized protein LOC108631933 [Ceratina calcarata]